MVASGNVGLAFGLVVAAGLSTTLGASVVFCTSLAQPKLLACSLGFAAGVMLFVSFSEILMRKSVAGFGAVNLDSDASYRYAILCFFGGMLVIAVLDQIVHLVADLAGRRCRNKSRHTVSTANLLANAELGPEECSTDSPAPAAAAATTTTTAAAAAGCAPQQQSMDVTAAGRAGLAAPPTKQQQQLQSQGASGASSSAECWSSRAAAAEPSADLGDKGIDLEHARGGSAAGDLEVPALGADVDVPQDALQMAAVQEQSAQCGSTSRQPPAVVEIMKKDHHNWALKKMGVLTGLAIFIHNFPEGLATFVGALADTSVGVGIAVAIAMHNIPEGICVAMPIYYATGSKWKGFLWAFLSGVSEPVGGLMGYLMLNDNQDLAFAIVFALVAGMMVYISIKELVPTALKYDPDDKVVTSAVIAGMAVIAGSLLLFTL